MSAEYIMAGGNDNVILCERGIRTFETYTRNTLDLSAVLAVKKLTHLPVVVDPSHACRQALDGGAHGHGRRGRRRGRPASSRSTTIPPHALCDGAQSITPAQFDGIMDKVRTIAACVDREV